jgi:glycosyltransferase involved in cell wall biosynthesis
MTKPFFSIIIPVYNQANFLGEAIQSALEQTYSNYEIIVVDDGSSDNCREVVAEFGDKVRYIWQENKGLGGARNTGILAAKGELIALLDSDDQWMPTFLEYIVTGTHFYPDADVIFCSARAMDADGHDLAQVFCENIPPPDLIYSTLLRANFLIPSTVVIRRAILMSVGLFEQTDRAIHGCEDWDLWLRIASDHKFVGSYRILVRYRLHGSSLSSNPSNMQQAVRAVIEKNFGPDDGHPENWPPEKRRAYGGVYRYHLLTSVQRQKDWQAAKTYLSRALHFDPTLAIDLDLFYDLALGNQPPGYRGSGQHLNLDENAIHVEDMLAELFCEPESAELQPLRSLLLGTAYYALGLVANNIGERSICRRFFTRAIRYRPDLVKNTQILNSLIKSFINQSTVIKLKEYSRLFQSHS